MSDNNLDWDSHFVKGDELIDQTRYEHLELLRRAGDLWPRQLKYLQDLGRTEDSYKREYGGRYLFELLQNANDAITDKLETQGGQKTSEDLNRVRIEITPYSILVANDGLPFEHQNVDALCRLHHSTKSASKQIGHKGIGFKSVLEVTDQPQVFSDYYAFTFDRDQFADNIREITQSESIESKKLQILLAPFPVRLKDLPDHDSQRITTLLNDEYATVIRLPLKTDISVDQICKQVVSEIKSELLLFLEAIEQIHIRYPSGEETYFWSTAQQKLDIFKQQPFREVTLWSQHPEQDPIPESHWLLLASEEISIVDRSFVTDLDDAWQEVQGVTCSVAFPLSSDGEALRTNLTAQPFHVYFPTEEKSGLRFLLNADLFINTFAAQMS